LVADIVTPREDPPYRRPEPERVRKALNASDLELPSSNGRSIIAPQADNPVKWIALFVDGRVVAATQKDEIRECRRAALGPVTDVMTLAEADSAAGEPTASVPMVERAS
jgi:hypothetical protein